MGKVESKALSPSFDAFCAIAKVLSMTDMEVLFLVRNNQKEMNEDKS